MLKNRDLFKKAGVESSFMETMSGKNAFYDVEQEGLTKLIGEADTEAKKHKLKGLLAQRLSKISGDFSDKYALADKEDRYNLSGKYMKERAILKDAMGTIDQSLASMKAASKADNVKDSGAKKASDLEKLAQANKPTQINIHIENLVREMTNKMYQSVGESLDNMAEAVSKVFTAMVNDVSVLQQVQ